MSRRRPKEVVLDRQPAGGAAPRNPFDGAWGDFLSRANARALDTAGTPTLLGVVDALVELAVARKALSRFGARRVDVARRVRAIRDLKSAGVDILTTVPVVTDVQIDMALRRVDRAHERLDEIAAALPRRLVARAAEGSR